MKPPLAGQPAPEFTLPSQDGAPVTLAEFRGKWVLLYFYPKDNTTGCTLEAQDFQYDLAKYEHLHAVVLGVSLDSQESHRDFCRKQHLTFRLLSDRKGQVAALYGSLLNLFVFKMAIRNTFLIDPAGVIAKVWLNVSPSGHSAAVLSELEQRSRPKTALE
jgi:peroxiredoxin Q/BCP